VRITNEIHKGVLEIHEGFTLMPALLLAEFLKGSLKNGHEVVVAVGLDCGHQMMNSVAIHATRDPVCHQGVCREIDRRGGLIQSPVVSHRLWLGGRVLGQQDKSGGTNNTGVRQDSEAKAGPEPLINAGHNEEIETEDGFADHGRPEFFKSELVEEHGLANLLSEAGPQPNLPHTADLHVSDRENIGHEGKTLHKLLEVANTLVSDVVIQNVRVGMVTDIVPHHPVPTLKRAKRHGNKTQRFVDDTGMACGAVANVVGEHESQQPADHDHEGDGPILTFPERLKDGKEYSKKHHTTGGLLPGRLVALAIEMRLHAGLEGRIEIRIGLVLLIIPLELGARG